MPDDKKGLLEVFTNKVYGAMRSTLPTNLDSTFKSSINEWEKLTSSAAVKQAANATAKSRTSPATKAKDTLGQGRRKPSKPASKNAGRK